MKLLKKVLLMACALLLITGNVFASPEAPTDEEVTVAYHNAAKIYDWFDHRTLPTNGLSRKAAGFMIYYNVEYPGIKTMSDLRRTLYTVFTPELSNMLISSSRTYREFNNVLYVAPAGRGNNIFAGNTTFDITRPAADKILLQAKTEIYDSANHATGKIVKYNVKDFNYVKTTDGWRFSTFSSIK